MAMTHKERRERDAERKRKARDELRATPAPAGNPFDKSAAKAAGVLKSAAKAAEVLNGASKTANGASKTKSKPRPRQQPRADASSFLGRIDLALAKLGLKRVALEKHLGTTSGYLAHFGRGEALQHGYRLAPPRMLKAAEFLGVTVPWLDKGEGDAPASNAVALKPTKAPKVSGHANGHDPVQHVMAKREVAMHADLDTAMQSLWGVLALDVKSFLIARASELLGQHLRRGAQ